MAKKIHNHNPFYWDYSLKVFLLSFALCNIFMGSQLNLRSTKSFRLVDHKNFGLRGWEIFTNSCCNSSEIFLRVNLHNETFLCIVQSSSSFSIFTLNKLRVASNFHWGSSMENSRLEIIWKTTRIDMKSFSCIATSKSDKTLLSKVPAADYSSAEKNRTDYHYYCCTSNIFQISDGTWI